MSHSCLENNEEPRLLQDSVRPFVQGLIAIYNYFEDITDFFDDIVDQIEDLVDQLREAFKPLDILILFAEMIVSKYEIFRSFGQVLTFIEAFLLSIVNAYKAVNTLLIAVNVPPLDLGLD